MKTLIKAKTNPLRIPRAAVKTALLAAGAVILYHYAHACATAQRGYEAIGGEILIPLVPLLIWLAKNE